MTKQKIKCVHGTYSHGKQVYKSGVTYLVDVGIGAYLCGQATPEGKRYFEAVIEELPEVTSAPVVSGRGKTRKINRKKKVGKKKDGKSGEVNEPPLNLTPKGQVDKDWDDEGGESETDSEEEEAPGKADVVEV